MKKITTGGRYFLVIVAVALFVLVMKRIQYTPPVQVEEPIVEAIETGLVIEPNDGEISGNMIYSTQVGWTEIPKVLTLEDFTGAYDRYTYLLNETSGSVVLNIPEQPKEAVGNYSGNTAQLNQWMKRSLQGFTAPNDIAGGYIMIKLRSLLKTIDNKGTLQSVVVSTSLSNKGRGIYGRLLVKNAIKVSEVEYLFPLDKVTINNSKGDDRTKLLIGQEVYIGGFVGAYDNGIEQIIITRY